MGLSEAVSACFSKYATFSGRARRSEYWFFVLFQLLVQIVSNVIDYATGAAVVGVLAELALLLPGIAVGVRRLHDIDKAGWWLLVGLIPVIGWILLIVWTCTKGSLGPNRFGPDPLPAGYAAAA